MNIERERGKCKYPLLFQPLKVNKIVLKTGLFRLHWEVIQINH